MSLPAGCSNSNFLGPGIAPPRAEHGFRGCVTGVSDVLLTCCARMGSTPVFAFGVCGCPYTGSFNADTQQNFGDCTLESLATATCYIGPDITVSKKSRSLLKRSAAARRARAGNGNAAVFVLGVALLLGVVAA
ncbi:hypothetical protein B0H15DRAFT_802317 [Mycena belliarum]|uniref:Uncharacterized protein n=1 Tax=Mycena belliarum TaxID=1033014 RepID=A0AAD6U1D5_9AGAR|nr:hypothetical protein B0H15DRAFT_802317 [Mycena belliae]